MSRVIAISSISALLFAFGAIQSEKALVRVACEVALAGIATVLVVTPGLTPGRRRRVTTVVLLAMLAWFGLLAVVTVSFGGGALAGGVTPGGEFFLRMAAQRTVVTRGVYSLVATAEIGLFGLWVPGLLLAMWPGESRGARSPAGLQDGDGRPTSG